MTLMKEAFGVLLVMMGVLIPGCNRDPFSGETDDSVPEEEELGDDPGDGDGDKPGDGDGEAGDGDGEPGCEDDEIECDGACIDPNFDANNCGQCGRTCYENAPWLDGGCWYGECLPTYSGCVTQAMGHSTCAEVCVSFGEVCHDDDDDLKCFAGVARGWDEEDGLEACEDQSHIGSLAIVENCEHDIVQYFDTYPYIRCCCSQTAQLP